MTRTRALLSLFLPFPRFSPLLLLLSFAPLFAVVLFILYLPPLSKDFSLLVVFVFDLASRRLDYIVKME